MNSTIKNLMSKNTCIFIFVVGVLLSLLVASDNNRIALIQQPRITIFTVFINNLKVFTLLILTGLLSNMIIPTWIILFNGFYFGILFRTNLAILGAPQTLVLSIHVILEIMSFQLVFNTTKSLINNYVAGVVHFKRIRNMYFLSLLLLFLASVLEYGEVSFFGLLKTV